MVREVPSSMKENKHLSTFLVNVRKVEDLHLRMLQPFGKLYINTMFIKMKSMCLLFPNIPVLKNLPC